MKPGNRVQIYTFPQSNVIISLHNIPKFEVEEAKSRIFLHLFKQAENKAMGKKK